MDGDQLLVDTLKEPREGNIVIARVDGALTVKTLNFSDGGVLLSPENPKYEPIQVDEDTAIIGVVVASQRDFI
jgi:DNA polymerase V